MIFDEQLKTQLLEYLKLMEGDVQITLSVGDDKASQDMKQMFDEVLALSTRVMVEAKTLERTPSFSIDRLGEDTGIVFAGVPLGHEFSSFVLALLQVSGRPPKVEADIIGRIKAIKETLRFETYVSLSCHNCPEVVQALNLMSLLNPNITHTMIDGTVFQAEVDAKEIMGVPAIYLNGSFFGGGRLTIDEILTKLGQTVAWS